MKSAERTIRVLEVLAASPEMLTLPELQDRLGYPRSSLYALVRTLREVGWVETDSSGARYAIGPDALCSGSAYLDRDPALPHVARALERLGSDIEQTVHYARRDLASVFYLASHEAAAAVQCAYQVGRRLPAHVTALGKALLAELTRDEVETILPVELVPFTDHTVTDRERLHRDLADARRTGWAIEREEGTLGVACVAAVVSYRIPATDAISCTMPAELAKDPAELERITTSLLTHSQQLAQTLRQEGIR